MTESAEELVASWEPEFRAAYEQDQQNAGRQTYDAYWRWVRAFFISGGAGYDGWLGQLESVLGGVRDPAAGAALRARAHAVGRLIAAEWSKERRRIYSIAWQGSPNLQGWGRELRRAAAADSGDGAALGRALDAIEREAREAIGA